MGPFLVRHLSGRINPKFIMLHNTFPCRTMRSFAGSDGKYFGIVFEAPYAVIKT